MTKSILVVAALAGFAAVALGAFGAHGLKGRLAPEMMAVYQTAVQYHFYHALALFGAALLMAQQPALPGLTASAVLFVVGLLLFSGSLYLLALTGVRWLGAITPLGGVAWLLAWLCLARAGFGLSGSL